MTIRDVLQEAVAVFTRAGIPEGRLDAEVLLAHCLNAERLFLFTHPETEVTEEQLRQYRGLAARRLSREPVAYIVGQKEFWSLSLDVDGRVLIPRPETEVLVEEALKIAGRFGNVDLKILDIGVGSGAISLALAAELKNAHVYAVDISPDAVAVAAKNAAKLGLRDRISFLVGDLVQPVFGRFEMIVSNPPYIAAADYDSLPEDVRGFEPLCALRGGPDGLSCYEALVREGGGRLKSGGYLLLEIGAEQRQAIENLLRGSCLYDEIRFRTDYAGIERVSVARRL